MVEIGEVYMEKIRSGPRTEPWGTPTKHGLGEMSENQCALTESYHTDRIVSYPRENIVSNMHQNYN